MFVTFITQHDQNGFVAIEVKYHEDLADKDARISSRCVAIAKQSGLWNDTRLKQLRTAPLGQIWRDHQK